MFFIASGDTFIEDPGKIFTDVGEALKRNLTDIRKTVIEIDGQFGKVAQSIGAGREQSLLLKKTITENLSEVIRLGGKVDDIVLQQTSLTDTFGRSIVLNKESVFTY